MQRARAAKQWTEAVKKVAKEGAGRKPGKRKVDPDAPDPKARPALPALAGEDAGAAWEGLGAEGAGPLGKVEPGSDSAD